MRTNKISIIMCQTFVIKFLILSLIYYYYPSTNIFHSIANILFSKIPASNRNESVKGVIYYPGP